MQASSAQTNANKNAHNKCKHRMQTKFVYNRNAHQIQTNNANKDHKVHTKGKQNKQNK